MNSSQTTEGEEKTEEPVTPNELDMILQDSLNLTENIEHQNSIQEDEHEHEIVGTTPTNDRSGFLSINFHKNEVFFYTCTFFSIIINY